MYLIYHKHIRVNNNDINKYCSTLIYTNILVVSTHASKWVKGRPNTGLKRFPPPPAAPPLSDPPPPLGIGIWLEGMRRVTEAGGDIADKTRACWRSGGSVGHHKMSQT